MTNNGKEPDRLVAVSVSPQVAATAELHRTVRNGDMMKMEAVAGFDVPANGTLTLEPGANHIMFLRVAAALGAGTRFPVALRFERAGELTVEFEVRDSAGMGTASMSGAAMPGPGGTPRATP